MSTPTSSAQLLTDLGNHLIRLHNDPQKSQSYIETLARISKKPSNYNRCYHYVQNVVRVAKLDPRLYSISSLHLLRLSTKSPVFRRLYIYLFV